MMTVITISRYVPKQTLAQRVSYSSLFPDGRSCLQIDPVLIGLPFQNMAPSLSRDTRFIWGKQVFRVFSFYYFFRDPCVLDLGIMCDRIFGILYRSMGFFLLLMDYIFVVKALWHDIVVNIYVSTLLITMSLNIMSF